MRFSKKLIADAIALYYKGSAHKAIAQKLGINYTQAASIIQRHVFYKGLPHRKTHPQKIGERHNLAKLSDAQVLTILREYNEDLASRSELAEKYGVGFFTISDILRGKSRTDNPEINAYRSTIILRDERGRRKRKPVEKNAKKPTLHFSTFNNESGEPKKDPPRR